METKRRAKKATNAKNHHCCFETMSKITTSYGDFVTTIKTYYYSCHTPPKRKKQASRVPIRFLGTSRPKIPTKPFSPGLPGRGSNDQPPRFPRLGRVILHSRRRRSLLSHSPQGYVVHEAWHRRTRTARRALQRRPWEAGTTR